MGEQLQRIRQPRLGSERREVVLNESFEIALGRLSQCALDGVDRQRTQQSAVVPDHVKVSGTGLGKFLVGFLQRGVRADGGIGGLAQAGKCQRSRALGRRRRLRTATTLYRDSV